MKPHLVSFIVISALMTLSSCSAPLATGGCEADADCGASQDCKAWRCEAQRCVEEDAPAGTTPNDPSVSVPPCHRLVCDGHGAATVEVDPSAVPPDTPGDCMKPACAADGTVTSMPDPGDAPPDDLPGDCMKPACDASGNVTSVPADDPPTAACESFTCQNGQPTGTPANEGMVCSPLGFACGNTGMCDTCPPADASCTDPGPGATSHALGSAHDFGTIGFCDSDEITLCGALTSGTTAYFTYAVSGGVTFCDFDPFVFVQASAPVTVCQYFGCSSVPCPSGTTPSTLGGVAGCCIDGAATQMQIMPSCDDPQVYVTVDAKGASCTTYEVGFRS